jgi:hypothetical protein
MGLSKSVSDDLVSLKDGIIEELERIKKMAASDLSIDDFELDTEVLKTPKLHTKYNDVFTDHTLKLKDLYALKEKVKLERWKYYQGKQTDKYYSQNGVIHEKILKSDIDRYLSADEKLVLVNDIVSAQKAITDYLERCIKEIQSRNFHCRVALDWRKFTSGGV